MSQISVTRSPEEFFAEAFALHFSGDLKLPKNIQKLLLKTIQKVGRK